MSAPPAKPVPIPSPDTAEFWAGAARHELLIQRCKACRRHQFYPRMLCTACSSSEVEWTRAKGSATVRSYTVVRRAVSEAYETDVPYIVALVELDEGPTMMTNIIDSTPGTIRIGMRVSVRFETRAPGKVLPMFAPCD